MSGFVRLLTPAKEVLSVDLRALALFRVGLGLVLSVDALTRMGSARGLYSDAGALPRAIAVASPSSYALPSIHSLSGSEWWQAILFAVALLAAVCVLVGHRTRLATIVSWVLVLSVQNRNTLVLSDGDMLLRALLFWGMFLPLGARASVDRALSRARSAATEPSDSLWFGGGSIAIVLQIGLMYFATALLKSGREWWPDGTASYYALHLELYTTRFGAWMAQWEPVLRWSTLGVYGLELSALFLLICPLFFPAVRALTLAALMGLHLSFELTMRLGIFPWVDIVGLCALVPSAVFEAVGARIATRERLGLRIYYDGECGFCRKVVFILRELLLLPSTKVAPAQEDEVARPLLERERSWVVVDHDGKSSLRWEALVVVLEHSPWIGWLCRRLPLRWFRRPGDRAYRLVAENRSLLGRATKVALPVPPSTAQAPGRWANALALACLAYVAFWNATTIPKTGLVMKPPLSFVGAMLRLDQRWDMFAPRPTRRNGWYRIEGHLRDGTRLEPFLSFDQRLYEVSWEKPLDPLRTFPNARWRRYLTQIHAQRSARHLLHYGRYVCRSWNGERDGGMTTLGKFQIVFMSEPTPPPGGTTKLERVVLWNHDCWQKSANDTNNSIAPEPEPE